MKIYDTYFAMLENKEFREIGVGSYKIEYQTAAFSKNVYEVSSNLIFPTSEDAYVHWLEHGRKAGYEWSFGKDTLLKIALKAKDEPYLIDLWIEHHAEIVGYENIVILDCGSTNEEYIEKLERYASKILILPYRQHYNYLHSTRTNRDLYDMLSANCKYLTVLDADEFLFARRGALYSSSFVMDVLKNSKQNFLCGIWITAFTADIPFDKVYRIDVGRERLISDGIAGKAIAHTDILYDIGHLGHNLHVKDVWPFVGPGSFGEIFVLHLKNLPRGVLMNRIFQHLVNKSAIDFCDGQERIAKLERLSGDQSIHPALRAYANQYISVAAGKSYPEHLVSESLINTPIIRANSIQAIPDLTDSVLKIDWKEVIDSQIEGIR